MRAEYLAKYATKSERRRKFGAREMEKRERERANRRHENAFCIDSES